MKRIFFILCSSLLTSISVFAQFGSHGSSNDYTYGRVGIGTSNTTSDLTIYNSSSPATMSLQSETLGRFWIVSQNNQLQLGGQSASMPSIGVLNIDNMGRVAIGTNPSSYKLYVKGDNAYGPALFETKHSYGLKNGVISQTSIGLNTASNYNISLFKALFNGDIGGYAYNTITNGEMTHYVGARGSGYYKGKVGIGKTPTNYQLDVDGTGKFTRILWGNSELSNDQGGAIKLRGSSTSAIPYIDFSNKTTDYDGRIILGTDQRLQVRGRGGLLLDGMDGSILLTTKATEEIKVHNSINFDGRWNNSIGAYMESVGTEGFDMQVCKNLNNDVETIKVGIFSLGWYHLLNNSGQRKIVGILSGYHGLRFYTRRGDLRMNITEEGIVQIFKKLETPDVEVKNLTLPDYVFEPTYKLRSLEEVDSFIADKGHLPEVPSAAHVAENGMSIVEMNNTLLKKVEELTLYLIEQNERIKKLEAVNEVLINSISE